MTRRRKKEREREDLCARSFRDGTRFLLDHDQEGTSDLFDVPKDVDDLDLAEILINFPVKNSSPSDAPPRMWTVTFFSLIC